MNTPILLVSFLTLVAPLQASPLEDLRVFLKDHSGQTPIRLLMTGEFRQAVERRHKPVASLPVLPVKLALSEGASGFQVTWDTGALADAADRNPAEDLGMTLPNLAHSSTAWLDPICLARISNPVRSMQRLLQVAMVKDIREELWQGRPAQRLVLRFKVPVPERYQNGTKTTDGTLTVWVAPGGAPLASEVTSLYKGRTGHYFGDFSRSTFQKATYQVTQDRVFTSSQEVEDRVTVEWDSTRTTLSLNVMEAP